MYSLVIPDLPRILATPRQSVKALSQALPRNTGSRNRHEVTVVVLSINFPRGNGQGHSMSIHRPGHHYNGVYRIQHDLSHRSPHADDDNLHRRGDEGRAHCRDGLDDYLYQHIQQERMLALATQ